MLPGASTVNAIVLVAIGALTGGGGSALLSALSQLTRSPAARLDQAKPGREVPSELRVECVLEPRSLDGCDCRAEWARAERAWEQGLREVQEVCLRSASTAHFWGLSLTGASTGIAALESVVLVVVCCYSPSSGRRAAVVRYGAGAGHPVGGALSQ